MAKRIASHFIDELQSRVDIVSVINARVPLKKAGKDFQACCPFHNEKTPSFTVSAQKQFYYCFGCGAKGGAINFLMNFEHLAFVDAVEKLAEESGMTVEYEQLSQAETQKIEHRKTLQDLLDETATVYENNLYHQSIGAGARNYLHQRQLDQETTAFFRLGYSQAGNRLQGHFGANVPAEELKKAGLLGQSERGYYDFFRERLMFPIRDTRGRVLGFGARALGDAMPKYLNTGDTELFNKSRVLYGLYEELQSNRNIEHLIVVEGYMDVIALHQMGVHGAVAALGTAFTQGHLNLVRRYTKKLFICFDGDKAGRKAANRAMELILPAMTTDTEIRMVFLPEGEDPDTLVRKIGHAAFNETLTAGQYFSEFVCQTIIGDSDLNLIEGRGEMAVRAKALFDTLPEGAYKNALQQELTDRAGRDIYQLAQEASTPPASTHGARPPYASAANNRPPRYHSTPHRPFSVRPHALQGSLESRLVRRLLALPELAASIRHEALLGDSDNLDRELLYRLIQYLQCNAPDSQQEEPEQLQSIVNAFSDALKTRLEQVIATEKLETGLKETLEERKQRLKKEFLPPFERLLNDILRKRYLAQLNADRPTTTN